MKIRQSLPRVLSLALVFSLLIIASGPQGSAAASLLTTLKTSGSPVGSHFPISPVSNEPGHESELLPAAAFNSGFMQTYLVVWQQTDNAGLQNIYGQFLSRDGTKNGIRFSILQGSPTRVNAEPDIAYNPTRDQFLVVYEGTNGIYGQIINNTGTRIDSEIIFASGAGEDTYHTPAVAYSPTSQKYLIAWRHTQGAYQGIEARTLSGNGSSLGGLWEITGLILSDPEFPDVAYSSPMDEFLVVWQKTYPESSDHDIYGIRIQMGATPGPSGAIFNIFATTNDETLPSVGAIAKITGIGQYLVTCQVNLSGTNYINGQLLTDTGALDGPAIVVSLSSGSMSAVAGNASTQEYLVAWLNSPMVVARAISTAGMGGPIADMDALYAMNPAVASGNQGDFLIVVDDWISPSYPFDIFGYLWGTRAFLPLVIR